MKKNAIRSQMLANLAVKFGGKEGPTAGIGGMGGIGGDDVVCSHPIDFIDQRANSGQKE